jgi:hypothetical protein
MKKVAIILFVLFLTNCNSDDNKPSDETEFNGKWKLIEQYLDPGDGSGDFQPIESDRIIELLSDGTVSINGKLCVMSSEVGDIETGTYMITSSDEADTTYDGEIIPNTCSSRSAKIYFDLSLSGNLILWYPCIEGCAQKFTRI